MYTLCGIFIYICAMASEKQIDIIILIGIAKLLSDQSTYLIGEFSRDKKQSFNMAVRAVDSLVRDIEKDLCDHNKKTLLVLTESLNDGVHDLRKQLIQAV